MPVFMRAYRRGLRDVQRAVILFGLARCEPLLDWSAVLVAADWIGIPLRDLRGKGIGSVDPGALQEMCSSDTTQSDLVRGYLAGFDRAMAVVRDWQGRMNNLAAREALGVTLERLAEVRARMIPDERGRIRTLRTTGYIL